MASPLWLAVYSNGDLWISTEVNFFPPTTGTGSEAGTALKYFRINPNASSQKISTLTGSGNSSASALAVSGGQANRHGAGGTADSVDIT